MGFIKAFTGAISGTFADQWQDFYMPRTDITGSSAVYGAITRSSNAGRGVNENGSNNIISNDSKIVVPENTALITMQDGAITGCIAEPGGYIFKSNDPNSQSLFAGDGIFSSTLKTTWERFKFGGQPASQQLIFYVNMREIMGNTVGTQQTIYWNDSYLGMKAGGMARGTYSIKIENPILFVKNFVPSNYFQPGAPIFDFNNLDDDAVNKLFEECLTCLTPAISRASQKAKELNLDTMDYLQSNVEEFTVTMQEQIENLYRWSERGIRASRFTMQIDYDEKTQAMLEEIREDDQEIRRASRMGQAYSNNMAGMMAAASATAMNAAASNQNGAMMGFMGMNMANMQANNMMGASMNAMQSQQNQSQSMQQPMQQSVQSVATQPTVETQEIETPQMANPQSATAEDPYEKLAKLKGLLDQGVISQADFDAAKNKLLGI